MKQILSVLVLAALATVGVNARPEGAVLQHVYWNAASRKASFNTPIDVADPIAASIAVNNSGVNVSGWDAVYVETDNTMFAQDPNTAYYAAGYAEGAATVERIYQEYLNIDIPAFTNKYWSNGTLTWVKEHLKFMKTQVGLKQNETYWAHVGYMLQQIRGIADGYASACAPSQMLNEFDIFMINFHFELNDVELSVDPNYRSKKSSVDAMHAHCSAMIKVTPDDLFMTHITWFGYHTMLRQYKVYNFSSDLTISFSGYPATIASGDDWYMLSNGLTVQETTNLNYNDKSYEYTTPYAVSEFIRVMVSHRITTNGKDWTENFCQHNSGTYNNQWMVVNMNLYTPGLMGNKLPDGLLHVAEQMPGMCVKADVTEVLRNDTYWASYNLPYFPSIYNWSGALKEEQKYGTYFSYTKYARPQIFKRAQPNITDLDAVKKLMRYNDYKHDPLSLIPNCSGTPNGVCDPPYSADLSIACRADLNPKDGAYGPLGSNVNQQPFGALDAKIVRWTEHKELKGHVVSGPTSSEEYGVPKFRWSTSPFPNLPHHGQPDLYSFDWVTTDELWR